MTMKDKTKKETKMIRYSAYDQDDIRRVWGCADNDKQAIEQCKLALKEYLEKRSWYKNKKYKIKKDYERQSVER